jgi:hypothetical protein
MDTPITILDKPASQTRDLTIGCLIFSRFDQIDFPGPGCSRADSDSGNEHRRGA